MGIFILLERVCVLPIKFRRSTTLLFYHASGNGTTFPVVTKLSRFLTAPLYCVTGHTNVFPNVLIQTKRQASARPKGFWSRCMTLGITGCSDFVRRSVFCKTFFFSRTEGSEFEFRKSTEFSLLQIVQTGSGAYPASYPIGTRCHFPGGKAAGAWSWLLTSN
jgi:hypothetical protein